MRAYDQLLKAIPELAEIQSTVARAADEPMQANTEMRVGYTALSHALGRLLHGNEEPLNATFATYAAWSAKSLEADVSSATTRKAATKSRAPFRRPARWLYDTTVHATLIDEGAIARNISTGQAAIYEEIGSALRVLLAESLGALDASRAGALDWDAVWATFTHALENNLRNDRSGQKANPLKEGDVARLQEAFRPYFEVLRSGASAPDRQTAVIGDDGSIRTLSPAEVDTRRRQRAQLILLGNIRLVAYEQDRLQPVLDRNLAYLPQAVRMQLGARWSGRESGLSRHVFDAGRRARRSANLVDDAFQIAATRHVYSMIIGVERLRFGVDMPLPPPAHPLLRADQSEADRDRYADGNFFPYDLQVIERPDLWSEWHKHDRSDGQGGRTAVDNWLRYPERLNFIVNLFRSRQQLAALYEGPLSDPASTPARTVAAPPTLGPAHVELAAATRKRLEQHFPKGGTP